MIGPGGSGSGVSTGSSPAPTGRTGNGVPTSRADQPRRLELPQGELLNAWVLTDLSSEPVAEGSHGMDQWKRSPIDILIDDEWENQQLRQLLFKSQIYLKGKHRRFTIPLLLRQMRCLPERGGSALCHRDGQLIVIWDIATWKLHKAKLGEEGSSL